LEIKNRRAQAPKKQKTTNLDYLEECQTGVGKKKTRRDTRLGKKQRTKAYQRKEDRLGKERREELQGGVILSLRNASSNSKQPTGQKKEGERKPGARTKTSD